MTASPRSTIRRARAADVGALLHLYQQLVSNPALSICPRQISELETDADTALLVMERGTALVGTLLLCLCKDVMFQKQPFAVIENVVVDAQARSQGVGGALLREAERLSAARTASKILIMSNIERHDAHAFFTRLGYSGERKRGFVKYRRDFEVD